MVKKNHIVQINIPGGIVSAGDLLIIINAAEPARVSEIQFGTRQQMILKVANQYIEAFTHILDCSGVKYEVDSNYFPNIVSSYVTENVFKNSGWLSEGVYKDILDGFDYKPRLKLNIVDSEQTFVPFFTGNINFVSSGTGNYWYLYIRFPQTTAAYRWKGLVYSKDIPRISKSIENLVLSSNNVVDQKPIADVDTLSSMLDLSEHFLYGTITQELRLPEFSVPYYEGFNSYQNKSWLGIYRRDESFNLRFIKDICMICLQTKIGELYTTPWKSLVVKGIESKDRKSWDNALGKYRINVRHASNELNWQIEDNCEEGLNLKRYLIRQFDREDVRTFGLCFAIKTQPKTGLFGSVIIRKLKNQSANQRSTLDRFEILYTQDFNPNSKEYILFRTNIEKENLGVYLISLCKYFYQLQSKEDLLLPEVYQQEPVQPFSNVNPVSMVYQCKHCFTVYDREYGDQVNLVPAGKAFSEIQESYTCPTCDAPKDDFVLVEKIPLIV